MRSRSDAEIEREQAYLEEDRLEVRRPDYLWWEKRDEVLRHQEFLADLAFRYEGEE